MTNLLIVFQSRKKNNDVSNCRHKSEKAKNVDILLEKAEINFGTITHEVFTVCMLPTKGS